MVRSSEAVLFVQGERFFVGVLLDQGQKAKRAWDGANHFVSSHFQSQNSFWAGIRAANDRELRNVGRTGYDGKSYASVCCVNKFPAWLRSAANRMQKEYDDDPRNIWAVRVDQVQAIYEKFLAFDGIGDALAKMAQFILVRNYGIAGGKVGSTV